MVDPRNKTPAYRAYVIGPDGRIKRAHELYCKSDDDAVTAARQYVDGHAVEVWDKGRKVALLPPIEQPPSLSGPGDPI